MSLKESKYMLFERGLKDRAFRWFFLDITHSLTSFFRQASSERTALHGSVLWQSLRARCIAADGAPVLVPHSVSQREYSTGDVSVLDPGSGAFLPPGSGMGKNPDPDPV